MVCRLWFVVCRLSFVVCCLSFVVFLLFDRKRNREVHRRIHGIALLLALHDIRLSVGSACGNYGAVVVLFCCSGAVVGSGPVCVCVCSGMRRSRRSVVN